MRISVLLLLTSLPAWAQMPYDRTPPSLGSVGSAGSPGPPNGGFGGNGFGGNGFAGNGIGGGFPGKPMPFPGARLMDLGTLPGAINAGPHRSNAAVVELLEDHGSWVARQLHPPSGAEAGARVGVWTSDRYSGTSALKVTGYQRYHEKIPGWLYPITENPKEGEYRYLRFAWKKPTGRGIMLQLCASGIEWARYYAGPNSVGFAPALQVQPETPQDWTVVTRDLWADFHAKFTVTGIAFTAMDEAAYFDHVYLGRTLEDLDRVTKAHLQWTFAPAPLGRVQFQTHWQNLGHADAAVRLPATWAIARSHNASLALIAETLQLPDPATTERRLQQALNDLDAPRYQLRERASKELEDHGIAVLPYLDKVTALTHDNLDQQTRLQKVRTNVQQRPVTENPEYRRWWQVLRILEYADIKTAQPLLTKFAHGKLPDGISTEAQAILERRTKRTP